GGTLQIDGTVMPTNTVSGFAPGDRFDLSAVNFNDFIGAGGGAALKSNNVLEVVDHGATYDLNLDPAQDFSDPTKSFHLSPDGFLGTDVSWVTILTVKSGLTVSGASVPYAFVQQVFGTAIDTTVDYRGEQDVFGSAVNTTVDSGGSQIVYS